MRQKPTGLIVIIAVMGAGMFGTIMQSLKAGKFAPIYVLHGEELYFIDKISDYIAEHALDTSEKAFNQVTWYGKDVTAKAIIDEARQYPMMAQRRVVIVKEAQVMQDIKDLEHYAMQPSQSTILVICHPFKKIDSRTRFMKEANKNGVVFDAEKLKDAQLPGWVAQFVKDHKASIEPEAIDTLIQLIGNELARLGHAIENLLNAIKDGQPISRQLVLDSIDLSREYNVFELQKALGLKDAYTAQKIVRFFCADIRSHSPIGIIAVLYAYFSKLLIIRSLNTTDPRQAAQAIGLRSDYFAREYIQAARHYSLSELNAVIHILKKYDLYAKGVGRRNSDQASLLEQMIQEVMMPGAATGVM